MKHERKPHSDKLDTVWVDGVMVGHIEKNLQKWPDEDEHGNEIDVEYHAGHALNRSTVLGRTEEHLVQRLIETNGSSPDPFARTRSA